MGGAKRYPSTSVSVMMGFASLYPSYDDIPLHSRGALLRSSDAQFLANGCGRVSHLLHGPLQFILRNAESLQPVLDLEILAHVDLAAIGLVSLREVIHLAVSPWARGKRSHDRPVPMQRLLSRHQRRR